MAFPRQMLRVFKPMRWRVERINGWHRVSLRVAGHTLYFETRDGTLRPSLEALASLFLPPSLQNQTCVRFLGLPDPVWRGNTNRLAEIFSDWWWNGARLDYRFFGIRVRQPLAAPDTAAAFFSGGVDSFHTLLHPTRPRQALITVAGFDIPLSDTPRLEWMEDTLREMAAKRGLEAVWIRTNLRENRFFEATDWTRSHGAAMACVGHLLADRFAHLLIPSTSPVRQAIHWGSSAITDPLWSSSRTEFHYDGRDYSRNEKIDRIIRDPDVQAHLRVCWENRTGTVNCGACEKCCRTMLSIRSAGAPIPATFPPDVDLVAWLDHLSGPPYHSPLTYRELEERLTGLPELHAAMQRLRARPFWKPGDPLFRTDR